MKVNQLTCVQNIDQNNLIYDSSDSKWIRSGKVTRRRFAIRHTEHEKITACPQRTSRFYSCYPTKINHYSHCRKGYFENLNKYVAVRFSVNDEIKRRL